LGIEPNRGLGLRRGLGLALSDSQRFVSAFGAVRLVRRFVGATLKRPEINKNKPEKLYDSKSLAKIAALCWFKTNNKILCAIEINYNSNKHYNIPWLAPARQRSLTFL